ncbi:hypothetical protein ACJIZ3_001152 [Penstemon smallii]|uniref:Uncharacterized protein n=1 Tax=Penstemon smallii TaxID=265156 RepID=A0ABD3U2S3_9LAMI
MSLTLLQGYSSAEEEEQEQYDDTRDQISSDDDPNDAVSKAALSYKPLLDPNPPSSSSLPSALHAFSEISGPPQFLNSSVKEEPAKEDEKQWRHGGRRNRRDKKDLPSVGKLNFESNAKSPLKLSYSPAFSSIFAFNLRIYFHFFRSLALSAVVESKPQLVGIHERVRSDIENKGQSSGPGGAAQGAKRVATVGNPNAEDAAELLRMCVRCGIPKTYSHAKGMVCPVCGDRPPVDSDKEAGKKKGSTLKDKEKSKRMKGQSSHATWKSETEMHLRQQFD